MLKTIIIKYNSPIVNWYDITFEIDNNPTYIIKISFYIFILLLINTIAIFVYMFIFKRIFRRSQLPFNKTIFTGHQILLNFLKFYNINNLTVTQGNFKYYSWSPWSKKVYFFNRSFYMNNIFSNSIALISGYQLVITKNKKWKYILFYWPFSLKILWLYWLIFYIGIIIAIIVKTKFLLWFAISLLLFMFLFAIMVTLFGIIKNKHIIYNFIHQEKTYSQDHIKKLKKSISIYNFMLIWSFLFSSCFLMRRIIITFKCIYNKFFRY